MKKILTALLLTFGLLIGSARKENTSIKSLKTIKIKKRCDKCDLTNDRIFKITKISCSYGSDPFKANLLSLVNKLDTSFILRVDKKIETSEGTYYKRYTCYTLGEEVNMPIIINMGLRFYLFYQDKDNVTRIINFFNKSTKTPFLWSFFILIHFLFSQQTD